LEWLGIGTRTACAFVAILFAGAFVVALTAVKGAGLGIDAKAVAVGFAGRTDAFAFAASLSCGAFCATGAAVLGIALEVDAVGAADGEGGVGTNEFAGAFVADFAVGTGIVACTTVPGVGLGVDADTATGHAVVFALACAANAAFVAFAWVVACAAVFVIGLGIDANIATGDLFATSELALSVDAVFSGLTEPATSTTIESILCEVGAETVAARFAAATGALSFVAVFAAATALSTGATMFIGGVGVKATAATFGGRGSRAFFFALSGDADVPCRANGVALATVNGVSLWVDAFVVAP
jgi:hypothetical protein